MFTKFPFNTKFEAERLALQAIAAMREPLKRLEQYDANLADQVRRALQRAALNLGEGSRRRKGDRRHAWDIAAGEAREARTGVGVAVVSGYLSEEEVAEGMGYIDRTLAVTWRLVHPKGTTWGRASARRAGS